jgi:hypothetical protein
MEVEYAFLADAADAPSPGGKLYLLGAGFNRIFAESFPVAHPYMALIVKIRLHPTECDRPHALEVDLWNPDGQRVGPTLRGTVQAPRDPSHPARPAFVQMVLGMFGTVFPQAGTYEFHIVANGQHLKAVELYAEPPEPPAPETEAEPDAQAT